MVFAFWQSFQHKSFWLPRDAGCFAGENVGHENSSSIEPKRNHQWFMNTGEPEIFNNKKQAVEAVGGRPFSGVSHMNVSPWDTNLGFHSVTGQFSDRLFGSDLVQSVNLVDKSMPSIGSGNLNVGRKDFENQYGNDQSVGLSISHNIADPSSYLSFGGIRKVKVNQVRDSYNCLPASIGHSYSRTDNSTISVGAGYNRNDGNISLGSAYNHGNDNTIPMGTGMSKTDDNLVSMGHAFNKGDGSFMLMGHNYGKGDESILLMSQPFNRGDFISMGQSYEKGDSNLISLGSSYTKGHENFISTVPTYSKSGEIFINIGPSYDKGTDHTVSLGPTYNNADSNITSTVPTFDRGDSSSSPLGNNYNEGESSTISFGAFSDNAEPNPSGGIINGYNLLMGNRNLAQGFDSQKDLTKSNSEPPVNSTPKPNTKSDTAQKNKEPKKPKKAASNNFPSNVKSLLTTGIFDGVPVKYVSWSREVKCVMILSCYF